MPILKIYDYESRTMTKMEEDKIQSILSKYYKESNAQAKDDNYLLIWWDK